MKNGWAIHGNLIQAESVSKLEILSAGKNIDHPFLACGQRNTKEDSKMVFKYRILLETYPLFISGTLVTIKYSILAILLAIVWGIIIGSINFSKNRGIGLITKSYVIFFRETPLLVQLYFLFYGLSRFFPIPAGICGVIGLVLNDGAFIAEIIRGGLQSIDKRQTEASYALGFSNFQTLIYFLIPQAVQKTHDSIMNIVAVIIKDTSLLMWITILELTHQTQQVNIKKFEPVTAFVTGAIIYFALFSSH